MDINPASLEENLVYGSSRPGYPALFVSQKEVLDWIEYIKNLKIKSIICLLSSEEITNYYEKNLINTYKAYFPFVFHFPWQDYSLCSQELFSKIIMNIANLTKKQLKVLVHCSAGVGRTGLVLAGWLVYKYKISPEKAIEIQKSLGRNPLEACLVNNYINEEDIIKVLKFLF